MRKNLTNRGAEVTKHVKKLHHPHNARKPRLIWNGVRWVHRYAHNPAHTFSARWHSLVCMWCQTMNYWSDHRRPTNTFAGWPKQ